jgi:hypothetical protein
MSQITRNGDLQRAATGARWALSACPTAQSANSMASLRPYLTEWMQCTAKYRQVVEIVGLTVPLWHSIIEHNVC